MLKKHMDVLFVAVFVFSRSRAPAWKCLPVFSSVLFSVRINCDSSIIDTHFLAGTSSGLNSESLV